MKWPWNKFGRIFVFSFVFMWHCPGTPFSVVIWVLLNCFVLHVELAGEVLMKTSFYKRISNAFGERNLEKLGILLGSQLLLISTVITMLYLTDDRVAAHIANEIYFNTSFINYFVISFIVFSVYHSCAYLFKIEKFKQNKLKISN